VLAHGPQTGGAASRACAKGPECGNPAFIRNIMGDYYPGKEGKEEGAGGKGRVLPS